ncbi:MAG: ABC transporter ATP-binding protein [Dongiaceae bacterium]
MTSPDAARPVAAIALGFAAVSHHYGRLRALDAVTVSVAPGEVLCVVGPSGCGKSTLLRIAAGLEELQRGRVTIADRLVADPTFSQPPEQRGVGLLFQDYALFPHLSVLDNVSFGLRHLGAAPRRKRAAEVLEQVGMSGYTRAFPHTLSGGQQQRVALARALAPAPRLLLLDEPFSGLDTQLREQVRDDALRVVRASGAATVLVTHEPEEAMFMADRIAILRAGRLEQIGSAADLYDRPANGFVAGFFSSVNRLTGRITNGQIDTPLGPLIAPADAAEGSAVEVVIRPEALKLTLDGAGGSVVGGQVTAARLLGRTSLVDLTLLGGDGTVALRARVPGRFLPRVGSPVGIALDRIQTFVFPVETPTS